MKKTRWEIILFLAVLATMTILFCHQIDMYDIAFDGAKTPEEMFKVVYDLGKTILFLVFVLMLNLMNVRRGSAD